MRKIFLLGAFLQGAACGPAFVVGWDFHGDGGETAEASDDARFSSTIDRQTTADAGVDATADADADANDPEVEASSPEEASPICTAIPFAARSNCPTTTGCVTSSCSDPLLYAPASFWLECSSRPTPARCQCAETYNCACLERELTSSCKGTLLCDPGAAAPALFLRCVPGPDF